MAIALLLVAFMIRLLWIHQKTKRWREVYLPLHDQYRLALADLRQAEILGKSNKEVEALVKKLEHDLKHWLD